MTIPTDTTRNRSLTKAASLADPSTKYNDDGMPEMKPPAASDFVKQLMLMIAALVLPLVYGFLITYYIILFDKFGSGNNTIISNMMSMLGCTDTYTTFDRSLSKSSIFQLGYSDKESSYLFFSLVIFGRLQSFLNNYPAIFWKTQVMPLKGGNLRSNMYIYSLIGELASSKSYVILEPDGAIGSYNRANRSLSHFVENSAVVVASMFCCSLLLPWVTFLLVLTFCIGRVMHQVGYSSGYGSHAIGFLLSLHAISCMEGILLCAGMSKMGWM